MKRNRWTEKDKQSFADGDRLRARREPGLRYSGPTVQEGLEEYLESLSEGLLSGGEGVE